MRAHSLDLIGRGLDLRGLAMFCRVAELGSISAAAREMMLSQPSLSRHVRALESTVALRLLERRPRGVALTPEGEAVYRHSVRIIAAARDAWADIVKLRSGRARVVLGIASGVFLLATGLLRDLRRRPDLPIDLVTVVANTQELLRELQAGRLDLALVWDPGRMDGLRMERLASGKHAVILSPSHPLASKQVLPPDDLKECEWILTPHGTPLRAYVERTLRRLGLVPRLAMEFGHAEVIKVAVQAGLGVSILACAAVDVEVRSGMLVSRPIEGTVLHRDLCLLHRKTRDVPPAVAQVAHAVRSYPILAR